MDAATKIAKQRLSVLELAEILGNAPEACRRRTRMVGAFPGWKVCSDAGRGPLATHCRNPVG